MKSEWLPIELWAFQQVDKQCSSNSGPDEDEMRRWLREHYREYAGDTTDYELSLLPAPPLP